MKTYDDSAVTIDMDTSPLMDDVPISRIILIEIIQLLPCLIAWSLLNFLHDGLIALLVFQLYIGTIPFIYSHIFNLELRAILAAKAVRPRVQLKKGALIATALLASMLIGFFVLWGVFPWVRDIVLSLNIPLKRSKAGVIMFCVVFSFINPLLEEVFWRGFLPACFKKREFWVTVHYALYHLFAIQYLMGNWYMAILGTVGIYVLGRIFEYLHKFDGIIASTIAHAAVDWVAVIVFLFLYVNYPDLYKH